ncbi:MAG TPA: hypothetical protein VLS51_04775 [Propionibacteriaceae bacterium]|nr:hypothetical protein [Propionibacteriaceae bacterium]
MTNPYGTDRGAQPQGLGDPGNQGPQFVAPRSYGGYAQQPGAYGQQPGVSSGQPGPYAPQPGISSGQPGPYAPQPGAYPGQPFPYGQQGQYGPPPYPTPPQQGWAVPPQYGFQPPRPPRTSRRPTGVLVLIVVLAVLTGVVYGGYELYRSTVGGPVTQATPTRPARTISAVPSAPRTTAASTATRGAADCLSGDRITTDAFVATVPTSWACDGDDGDVSITSTRSDAMWVEHDTGSGDPTADCKAQLEGLGDLKPLPSETWGGKTALAFQAIDSGDIFGVRCTVVGSQSWYLMYFPLDASDDAAVRADVTTLLRTWVWR